MKEETFWEFRRKITGKSNERPHVIKNNSGEVVEDKENILEMFQNFYTNLFTRKPCDQAITEGVNGELQDIIDIAESQEPLSIQPETIEKEIKKLKNKKASDKNGWRNEMLKYMEGMR